MKPRFVGQLKRTVLNYWGLSGAARGKSNAPSIIEHITQT